MAATATPTRSLDNAQREWLKQMGAALGAPATETKSLAGAGQEVKGLIDPTDIIVDLTKTLLGPKKATCKLFNLTGRILKLDPLSLTKPKEQPESGKFKSDPPDIVEKEGEFRAESSTLAGLTVFGTEGEVRYLLDEQGTFWRVRWNNPFAKDPFDGKPTGNTADSTVGGPNAALFKKPVFRAGPGDEATFTYRLELVDGPVPPEPKPTPNTVDAASSCHITVTNETKVVLTFAGSGHERGNFMTPPDKTLKPGDHTTFVSVEVPNNQKKEEEGCKGFVTWQVGSPDVLWRIEWDNPEQQQNSAIHAFNPPNPGFNSANFIGQGEENVPVTFTLSEAGGGPVVPPVGTNKITLIVLNKDTDKPIEGASVDVEGKVQKTPANGKVDFQVAPGPHKLKATADGFEDHSGNFQTPDDEIMTVPLKPKTATGKLSVLVQQLEGGAPIENANVKVADKSAKTDKDGKTQFELPPGEHEIFVTAEGFKDNKIKATMKAGEDTFALLAMEKDGDKKKTFEPPPESKQPTLRRGAPKGDKWVEYLQKLLGFEGKDIDGDFGGKTEQAVKDFQKNHKPEPLLVDGIVGNQTWAALRGGPAEKPSSDGRKPNTFVEKGQEARWFTEKKDILTFEGDKLKLKVVSVGDADVEGVKARVRVTKVGGLEDVDDFPIGPQEAKVDGTGFLHSVFVPDIRKKFGPGTYTLKVEAFMPKELGGDLFEGDIEIK